MKKVITLVFTAVFVLCIYQTTFSQNAYYDALKLRSYINEDGDLNSEADTIYFILDNYIEPNKKNTIHELYTILNSGRNPFLSVAGSARSTNDEKNNKTGNIPKGIFTGIGQVDVTTIADGLAKFLVNRMKEELSAAFFADFKEYLSKNEECKILFPQTVDLLNDIDSKIYQFSSYLTELRGKFHIDLSNLPGNIPAVLELEKYDTLLSSKPWLKPAIKAPAFFIETILTNNKDSIRHPGKYINTLNSRVDHFFPLSSSATSYDYITNGSVKTAAIFSASIQSQDTTRFWIPLDSLKMFMKDEVAFQIYLGLIYEQALSRNVVYGSNKSLAGLLDTIKVKYDERVKPLKAYLEDFQSKMREANTNYRLLMKKKADSADDLYSYYYATYNSSIKLLTTGWTIINKYYPLPDIDKYTEVFHELGKIYVNVNEKKFTLVALSLMKLLEQFNDPVLGKNKITPKMMRRLSTYTTFIAEVGQAENSDQVEKIIAKTVLPTGSSYIKKNSEFNISLNAYTGIYAGKQRQATDKRYVGAGGVYAPIGVAASWGIVRKDRTKAPWSVSLFASIVDLGPLVSYRFTNYNDTLANDIDVRLGQIVSPGGHLIIGIPKLPLSIGGGFNWSPLITNVEKDHLALTGTNKRPFRWQVFLAVDIPLLNFYNNPR